MVLIILITKISIKYLLFFDSMSLFTSVLRTSVVLYLCLFTCQSLCVKSFIDKSQCGRVYSRSSRLFESISETPSTIEKLRSACDTRSVPSADIIAAINEVESASFDLSCTDMKGSWELIFSSLIPGGYFPVCEICDFFGYSLTSSWGPLPLGGFKGSSAVISETKPATIEFTSDSYLIGGIKFDLKEPKKRSYTFLYTDDNFAVARSSSGGGTLLKKVKG